MNWRIWAGFLGIVAIFAVSGVYNFLQRPEILEPSSDVVTQILVDLQRPYSGEVIVSYPSNSISEDDFQVVVAARQDAQEFLHQYFVPYRDPERVRIDRRDESTSVTFPILARDRLEFAFPQVSFEASWTPLWDTLQFEVALPRSYDLVHSAAEGLASPLDTGKSGGRWVLQGEALVGGSASLTASYRLSGATP